MENFNGRKTIVIWIKVPPNKKLQPNEVRILNLNFEHPKINSKHQNHIFLNVSPNLPFPVFWILKSPKDFKIADQKYYTIEDNRWSDKGSWPGSSNNIFFTNDMTGSSSIFVKPYQVDILISYSFKPSRTIVTLPLTSLILLTLFSLCLIGAQLSISFNDANPKLVEDLLDRKIELSLFVISASLFIPRFINNIVIRHQYFGWYFLPIALIVSFLLHNLLM